MKRLVVVMLVLLAGCSAPASTAGEDGESRLSVVATTSVFAEFAEAVGGELVSVETLVPVGGDPHTYEPSPSDAARISDADVVLDNGLGLSPWFEPLATNVGGQLVTLTEGLQAEVLQDEGGSADPHLWMVPPFVANGYVTAIEEAFIGADPANAEDYAANARAYRQTLAELDAELQQDLDTIPAANRKLVTSHDAYRYFAQHYGLEVIGTVIGVSTEEQPSARSISRLVDLIQAEAVPTIFVETTINPSVVERVARDAGVEIGDPLYGDSVGEPGSGADDYVGMMRSNVRAIVGGLGGESP